MYRTTPQTAYTAPTAHGIDTDAESECPRCGDRYGVHIGDVASIGLPSCCGGPTVLVSYYGCPVAVRRAS